MTSAKHRFDAIIIGAGAAGLMCALTAGQRGRKVLLLEQSDKAGAKILISGGGRCNFTNLDSAPDRFISDNPHFCTSALRRYTQFDFIDLVQRHGIPFHEKTLGQLFCDQSARSIVSMLLNECALGNVDLRLGQTVKSVLRADQFRVETEAASFSAPVLVLATGGLSIPKMGATGFSHKIAQHFGLRVTLLQPGLVPFKAGADMAGFVPALAGVSFEAVASLDKRGFREKVLFTHRGLSGPAILQISSYFRTGERITLDFLPDIDAASLLLDRKRARPKSSLQSVLAELLPQRLAQVLASVCPVQAEIAALSDRVLREFAGQLKFWPFRPDGTEGYAKAEVTCGGIDTRDLSSKTMAARNVEGLYAIGEAVDVTGWLGGYNFQWAWSSGWVAGQSI